MATQRYTVTRHPIEPLLTWVKSLAGASGSGLVLGAGVPIALTSRADGPMNRAASALLAKLTAHSLRRDRARRAAAGTA